ncbi:hypothetical protein ASPFODRAFT_64700 [Aspergillus luchuensis CBS 106.47]|uniref:Uncharacterized protein n=1 Tax=Aspergillus luchuensis (strain CBS 106.47) TaxID=1137211 RepID=A0A1M3T5E6_ASPLC|nr:hypothetical protein ASPFODRAFT_64700 [Aspergillus luchuensis CBS 106.47]
MSYRKVSPLDSVDCKEELELVGELEDKLVRAPVVVREEMERITREVKMVVMAAMDSPFLSIVVCIYQCSQIPKCRMVCFHKGLRTCFFATRPGTTSGRAPDYDAAWVLGS